jgi:hypothetical protein
VEEKIISSWELRVASMYSISIFPFLKYFLLYIISWLAYFTLQYSTCRAAFGKAPTHQSPYFLMFIGPRNWFQGMKSATLCSPAGRYDNPIPPPFLAPIPALLSESDLLEHFRILLGMSKLINIMAQKQTLPPGNTAEQEIGRSNCRYFCPQCSYRLWYACTVKPCNEK